MTLYENVEMPLLDLPLIFFSRLKGDIYAQNFHAPVYYLRSDSGVHSSVNV